MPITKETWKNYQGGFNKKLGVTTEVSAIERAAAREEKRLADEGVEAEKQKVLRRSSQDIFRKRTPE